MTDAQQTTELLHSSDTIRTLTTQPNKSREGSHASTNILCVAFCIAGLKLTTNHQVRGDEEWFMIAFSIAIGVTVLEVFLNMVLMACSGKIAGLQPRDEDQGQCCKKCAAPCISVIVSTVYTVGCGACFVLLVISLVSSIGVPETEACGCVNNYGCANIMAIIACIIYGIRSLAIVVCLPCLIRNAICACSPCCNKTGQTDDGGESGQE